MISDRIFRRIIGRKSARPIDAKTEKELFVRYKMGDMEARDALVYANLRLVKSVARHFKPHKLTCNDIISEGLIGLLKAIDGFDSRLGIRFSTYASKTIYYQIFNTMNVYNSSIVLPSTIYSLFKKYRLYCDKYFQEYLLTPSDFQVAEELQISLYQAKGLRLCFNEPVSINHLRDLFGYNFVTEVLIDDLAESEHDVFDVELNYESMITDIEDVLSKLNKREADIIRENFGIGCYPCSLDELGLKYDLTRERVRQIREKAIKKIRNVYGKSLKQYLIDCF